MALGVSERSFAGRINPIADHVQHIGVARMRLLPVSSANASGAGAASAQLDQLVRALILILFATEPSCIGLLAYLNQHLLLSHAVTGFQQESVCIGDDVDVTDAINDWDTTRWSQDTVEAAFSTLLQECYAGNDDEETVSASKTVADRRRLLARGMLLKLTRCHTCAAKKLERSLEVSLFVYSILITVIMWRLECQCSSPGALVELPNCSANM
eukprot:19244-Heterococcus_DN1.PRE.2